MSSASSSSSANASTTPTSRTIPSNRYEGGRRFQNSENVAYVLPNDLEDDDRIHMQHWAIKLAFGTSFDAPIHQALEEGTNVLDSACGPATWTLEMAHTFPNSKLFGTDISPRFPEQIKPANCEFSVNNILDEPAFEDNYFGYIHQRLVIMGIKTVDWPKLLINHKRTLKPGGWIELTELSYLSWQNLGSNGNVVSNITLKIMGATGLDSELGTHLPELLSDAGFINVQKRSIDIPINHSGKVGELFWEDSQDILKSLKTVYTKMDPRFLEPGVFEKFIVDFGEECKTNKTTIEWTRCIAQKPLVDDN